MTARASGKFNARKYGDMLAQVRPRPIQSEAENERLLAVVDRFMAKSDGRRTSEEEVLLEPLPTDRTVRGRALSHSRLAAPSRAAVLAGAE